MGREESSEKDISSGHGIKQNSTEYTWAEERMPRNITGLGCQAGFALLSQVYFFLCKPYIA